jgi:hypothetical protein
MEEAQNQEDHNALIRVAEVIGDEVGANESQGQGNHATGSHLPFKNSELVDIGNVFDAEEYGN